RPQVITGKVEDGSGARLPRTVRLPLGIEHLVEDTIVHVHGEHVTVATRRHTSRWSTLDPGVRGDGIRARVALVVVVESHVDSRLARVHGDVRDPDGRALPESRPEVRVHGGSGADRVDELGRAGVDRQVVHPRVPYVIGREDLAAGQRWCLPGSLRVTRR